jgi:hypothetical protein
MTKKEKNRRSFMGSKGRKNVKKPKGGAKAKTAPAKKK